MRFAEDKNLIYKELKEAIENGQTDRVEAILPHVEDVNLTVQVDGVTSGTPIEIAIGNGRSDIIGVLLQNGSDINLMIKRHTPLMVACIFYQDMVSCLLGYGADTNLYNAYGLTALHYAAFIDIKSGRADIVKNMLEYGADVNFRSNSGSTPLGELLFMQKLRQRNRTENEASLRDFVDCVCLLLHAGAIPTVDFLGERESDLLVTVKYLVNGNTDPKYTIPSNIGKFITTAIMIGSFSWNETVILYRYIQKVNNEKLRSIEEILKYFLENGFTLKEICRQKIRGAIRPPLLLHFTGDMELPNPLKEYISFK
jgi:hypothetical protein